MMRETLQTKPNYYWISCVLLLLVFLVAYTLFFVYMGYSLFFEKGQHYEALMFLFPTVLFTAITVYTFLFISKRVNYAIANDVGLKIIFPLKFKSIFLTWDDIKGYSRSDYYYGGRIGLKSKSLVIYTRSNIKYELIKLYNRDFQSFQGQLRKFTVICFGHEGFTTKTHKLFFNKRVYKYDNMFD